MMVWARLQADVNCNLRRGAWYRLIKAQGLAAVVDVKGTPVAVVRAFLQMSNSPPRKWTVVPRSRRAAGQTQPPDVRPLQRRIRRRLGRALSASVTPASNSAGPFAAD